MKKKSSEALLNLELAADHYDSGGDETGVPLGRLTDLWPRIPNLAFLYLKGSSQHITDPDDIYFDKESIIQTEIGTLNLPKLKNSNGAPTISPSA